jgi:hypothetical protein
LNRQKQKQLQDFSFFKEQQSNRKNENQIAASQNKSAVVHQHYSSNGSKVVSNGTSALGMQSVTVSRI